MRVQATSLGTAQRAESAGPDQDPGSASASDAERLPDFVARVSDRLTGRWGADPGALDTICAYAVRPAGKLFRPALLIESALAVGGDIETVLPAAVGAESGHVASLVHDDIIDRDEVRRGRASVQHAYGVDNAIVAGDALIFDLFVGLAECRETGAAPARIVAALDVVARCGIDLCRGQSLEAELCARHDYDVDAYLRMTALKTAALFRAACECGALLGGGDEVVVSALGVYAENLGVAFQIRDDLLPYIADAAVVGKPATSDIRNGRMTLPVLLAHRDSGPDDRAVVAWALSGEGDLDRRRAALAGVLERTGAVAATSEVARQQVERALAALGALPPSPSRSRMQAWAEAAIARTR